MRQIINRGKEKRKRRLRRKLRWHAHSSAGKLLRRRPEIGVDHESACRIQTEGREARACHCGPRPQSPPSSECWMRPEVGRNQPQADQAFEVTSIKPSAGCGGGGRGGGSAASPGRMALECAELRDLILTAYGIYANAGDPNPRSFGCKSWGARDGSTGIATILSRRRRAIRFVHSYTGPCCGRFSKIDSS